MNKKAKFINSVLPTIGVLILVLSFRWILFEPYVIPSGSMIPSLLVHDHIVVSKYNFGLRLPFSKEYLIEWGEVKRGDIVVFRSVEKDIFMIKRVIGLPGDRVEVGEDGSVFINGTKAEQNLVSQPKSDEYLQHLSELDIQGSFEDYNFYEEELDGRKHFKMLSLYYSRYFSGPYVVPQGHYFVMGDNRDHSHDSRYWSFLPKENLLGKAQFIWLTCEETLTVIPFLCDPLTIRWSRMFKGIQ